MIYKNNIFSQTKIITINNLEKFLFKILTGMLVIFLGSKISIQFYKEPFPLQTFALLLVAVYSSPMQSFLIILSIALISITGFKVFAISETKIQVFESSAIGYIIGFIVATPIMSYLVRRNFAKEITRIIISGTIGISMILIFGTIGLSISVGFDMAFQTGFVIFIVPEILKITLACALFKLYK